LILVNIVTDGPRIGRDFSPVYTLDHPIHIKTSRISILIIDIVYTSLYDPSVDIRSTHPRVAPANGETTMTTTCPAAACPAPLNRLAARMTGRRAPTVDRIKQAAADRTAGRLAAELGSIDLGPIAFVLSEVK
jgi:hypothetical protein